MRMFISFVVGSVSFIKFNYIGVVSCSEIIIIAVLPFYVADLRRALTVPITLKVLSLGLLYLAMQMVSDWYRLVPQDDCVRGWARIFVTLLLTPSLIAVVFFGGVRATAWFLIGATLAPIGSLLAYGVTGELYKFYLGLPISIIAFLMVGRLGPRCGRFINLVPIFAGAVALMLNYRSLAAITITAGIIIYTLDRKMEKKIYRKTATKQITIVGFVVTISAVSIAKLYSWTASSGLLGEYAQMKYEMQNQTERSNVLDILLAGRVEGYFTIPKIIESPLVGHGSWAKDEMYVKGRAVETGIDVRTLVGAENESMGLIPAHSHILGAWMEAGIAGGVFWLYIFWITLSSLSRVEYRSDSVLAPILIFLLINFLWDLVFSPFGGERRVWNAFMIGWICILKIHSKCAIDPGYLRGARVPLIRR